MVNPIHISQQPKSINQDADKKIKELEEQNQNLLNRNYINSLSDDKIFRIELLQSIDKISTVLESLNNKISDLASQEAQ